MKAVNSGNWDLAAKKYLEGWDIDFSQAKDPRYKGGVADRMVRNQEAFLKYAKEFKNALNDDFNTPDAIAVLFELALEINKNQNIEDINLLVKLGNVIGILSQDVEDFLQDNLSVEIDVEGIIKQRDKAKAAKDYHTADKLRNDLLEKNILIEDTPSGTVWRRK